MLKRILFTLMLISMLIFGSSTAWAVSSVEHADGPVEETEQSQNVDVEIEQGQAVNSGGTADEIVQKQNASKDVEQSMQADEKSSETEEG